MLYLLKILYISLILPPGVFVTVLALLCLYGRYLRLRLTKWLALTTLIFYLGSTGLIGGTLIRSLETRHTPPQQPIGDVVIVLGGGATLDTPNIGFAGHLSGFAANRLITGVQLSRMLDLPVIVSGGKVFETTGTEADIFKATLLGLGVAPQRIFTEDRSRNTTENALYSKEIMLSHGWRRPILVTSAFHMERAVRQFAKAGVHVTPFPTDYQENTVFRFSLFDLLPTADGLLKTSLALKEYLGLLAVRWY